MCCAFLLYSTSFSNRKWFFKMYVDFCNLKLQEGFHNVTILGRNTLDESELVQVTFEMVGPTRGLIIEDWQEVTRLVSL